MLFTFIGLIRIDYDYPWFQAVPITSACLHCVHFLKAYDLFERGDFICKFTDSTVDWICLIKSLFLLQDLPFSFLGVCLDLFTAECVDL